MADRLHIRSDFLRFGKRRLGHFDWETGEELIDMTPNEIAVFTASDEVVVRLDHLHTAMVSKPDQRRVFLLSPVAISSDQQGLGIGTQLINLGLLSLRESGVDIAVTYGDPEYYKACRVSTNWR